MFQIRSAVTFLALLFSACALVGNPRADESVDGRTYLHDGWRMESGCKTSAKAEQISAPGFDDSSWHPAVVPGTVVGTLVTDKTLPDPNYGENLKSFPGAFNDNKHQAANLDMPADSRSEEHTSELQSRRDLVCRLLL